MSCRWWAIAGAALCAAAWTSSASADPAILRISHGLDLAELPLLIVEHDKLIEKHVQARNLGPVTVRWLPPSNGPAADSLARGEADIAAAIDLAVFAASWDERSGTPREIRALAALARMPYVLLTRNPVIATIRDFGPKDRIAVPVVKASLPAVLLQMAAAQEWGPAHYDKLDPLTAAHSDIEAATDIHNVNATFDTSFIRLPHADDARADRAIHRVMDSFDIAGPHSVGAILTTMQYRDANPRLCAAVVAALSEADEFIKRSPGAAAEIYASMTRDQPRSIEDLTDMLGDPDIAYTPAPAGMVHLTDFLRQIGRLKHKPDSWQLLFFPEIYKLSGS
jgi:NitT/TauT family transport system substrate-binding protein